MLLRMLLLGLFASCWILPVDAAEPLKVGVFDVDASPPVGSPLAYDPTKGVQIPLSARGIVLLGSDRPIVLCAVDWIGIGGGTHRAFRESLAAAAGTEVARVTVHTLHQHDAPRSDFRVGDLLEPYGLAEKVSDRAFAEEVIARASQGVRDAVQKAQVVTHVGVGTATVDKVASNRRILGPDGRVKVTRMTATKDPAVRAEPVGTIDPPLRLVTFWQDDKPLVAMSYYATHPQSYYRTGLANPDFPGMARNERQTKTGVPHIHFNGAGGNVGAGKWNDGSPENRQILADRVATGMRQAWEQTVKSPLTPEDVRWNVRSVALPAALHLEKTALETLLADEQAPLTDRSRAAHHLSWLTACQLGETLDVSCLQLGSVRLLHLPGELFVEYQLAAQALRPEAFVAMAAYGDYAPGYIGTEVAYSQGGYETSERASRVAPAVEGVLMGAIEELLSK